MPNVELLPYSRPSMWRRMSLGNWSNPTDPTVYGRLEVDMSAALAYAARETERTGARVTPTHMVVRAIALALKNLPLANAIVRFSRIYQRRHVDVFCQVAIPGSQPDLSGAVIRNAADKRPGDIANELKQRADAVRAGKDPDLERTRKTLDLIPSFLYRVVLGAVAFLNYTLNLDLRWAGLPKNAFGSAMVTSIGSLGIPEGFAPLVPMSRTPVLVSVGKVEDRAVVRDGQVVVRPICVLCGTFDHRVMDGLLAGRLVERTLAYLSDPEAAELAAAAVPEGK
jgi:pyruvate dehydrogenase E2 component (dihydrolipoamide acetyltransferase)